MFQRQRFNQDVAHELRTPLAILTSELDLLEDKAVAKRLRADLEALTAIVSQLLEAAEASPASPDQQVDLAAICQETASQLENSAAQSGRSIRVELPRDSVPVFGHGAALRRAVRNLLDNALTHSPAGGEVTLRITPPAVVEVADRGPGVPEAQKSKVFERFWRADRGHRRGGSGIGTGGVKACQESGFVGLGRRVGPVGRQSVSSGKHELTNEGLLRPAVLHELRGEMIEEFGMRGALAGEAAVVRGGDEAFAAELAPLSMPEVAVSGRVVLSGHPRPLLRAAALLHRTARIPPTPS